MGKPRLIILIRHAQSEGNKNRDIHQTVPDHRVHLTSEGHQQALEAGRKLRALLRPDDTLHFFTSPYRRTRETTEGILSALTSDDPSPSPFHRSTIKVYEEPRLREQDFGNFQPCTAEMERMWQERADYGHFFYRIPNGESAADAYDRVSGFNDSLWRRFDENNFASVCILVTHGLMTRVFLMKWYHFSVEYFEDLRNVNHCEFVVMKKDLENGKFILQNQLRTWSELKRERAARGSNSHATHSAIEPGIGDSPIPQRRRWGGCPDGCDHSQHNHASRSPQPRRQNTADLFKDDNELLSSQIPSRQSSIKLDQTRSSPRLQSSRDRYSLQNGDENGSAAGNNGFSLPENEDTVLDQDPDKISSATQLNFPITNRSSKHRFRNAQPISINLDETLIEEQHPTNSRSQDVSAPESPSPQPSLGEATSKAHSRTELPREALSHKLRSPRELALISMAGRDGGGSLSGAASPDEETSGEDEAVKGTGKVKGRKGGPIDPPISGLGIKTAAEEEEEDDGDGKDDDDEDFSAPSSPSHPSPPILYQFHNSTPPDPPSHLPTPSSNHNNKNSHKKPTPHRTSSLALALTHQPIPILNRDFAPTSHPHNTTTTTPTPPSSDLNPSNRAMADALGDQSDDADVTEDDDEMGISTRQRGEEERIWEVERRERGDREREREGVEAEG